MAARSSGGWKPTNGQVLLVNPNGIFFGETARVDVGGLVASGLDIKPQDFLNDHLLLKASSTGDGVVINQGLINAASGGSVALVGKQVANDGFIGATLGSVALAAGREAVLTFDPQGLLGVRITQETLQKHLGDDAAVSNSGYIKAPAGRVLLTASASQDVFSQAVNSGDLAGETEILVHDDGSFTLGKGADLVNTGRINARDVGVSLAARDQLTVGASGAGVHLDASGASFPTLFSLAAGGSVKLTDSTLGIGSGQLRLATGVAELAQACVTTSPPDLQLFGSIIAASNIDFDLEGALRLDANSAIIPSQAP